MSERKQAYKQGEDGRLYFTFNLGAEYTLRPRFGESFKYLICECEWDEATETEYFRINSAGKELPTRFTVRQVEFMLGQLLYEQTAAGKAVELPLLVEEVKAFYAAKRSEHKKANVRENEKLIGTAWNTNLKAIKGVKENLCYAVSQNNAQKVQTLGAKLAELEAEQEKILSDKDVDYRILTKAADCKECGDTGITGGRICACAIGNADKIKLYNALKRLSAATTLRGGAGKSLVRRDTPLS